MALCDTEIIEKGKYTSKCPDKWRMLSGVSTNSLSMTFGFSFENQFSLKYDIIVTWNVDSNCVQNECFLCIIGWFLLRNRFVVEKLRHGASNTVSHTVLGNLYQKRMHCSRMLTVRFSGRRGGGVWPGGLSAWRVSAQEGVFPGWGGLHLPSSEQNDWQTGVKTLPFRNFVCGR